MAANGSALIVDATSNTARRHNTPFTRAPARRTKPEEASPAYATVQIIAQGGNGAELPENTLPALRSALELGCGNVQVDVQLTADAVPVLTRAATLPRRDGAKVKIRDLSLAALSTFPAPVARRHGEPATDVGIPTLARAVQLLTAQSSITVFVEIESATLQHFGCANTIERVCAHLRHMSGQAVLVSADLTAVDYIRRNKGYRVGWRLPDRSRLSALKCEAVAPDFLFVDAAGWPRDGARFWRGPWEWVCTDVASYFDVPGCIARGARLIQTAEVRTFLRAQRRSASQSTHAQI